MATENVLSTSGDIFSTTFFLFYCVVFCFVFICNLGLLDLADKRYTIKFEFHRQNNFKYLLQTLFLQEFFLEHSRNSMWALGMVLQACYPSIPHIKQEIMNSR